MVDIFVPKISEMKVSREGRNIVLVLNDRRVCELPWDAALVLAQAITIQARRVEEKVKAEQVIADQAFAMRKGLPFGFSSNPVIIDEAKKEAAHNAQLRKYIPFVPVGIREREALGAPTLIKHRRR